MGGTADLNFLPSGTGSDADALLFGGCMLPECDPLLCGLSELQFLVPGRRPQESGHRTLNTAMVGLSAAQLPPMKLYAGDTIAYHTQMYVAGDPRGYRTAIVTHVDDSPGEAYTHLRVDG
ncbi:hypothetical protein F441_01202 [Phytophthora nicotianae CJ01A1]|uniref:Uncharacterized protein n=4 Tax=Phytophthora nicotianae TaxID=4792 RepID=W2XZG5_PHYNI|nr:hypothetical protein L915_12830 [Phytophthora nicotianae]ETO70286.1 hypothetical protein F444_13214 [Phytophthora nicotianae P1976]ETP25992.1 hypothetical protein F441_01202 [Phytophthora nicotianae CJ01A1]ETP28230.1 hypothetical protein F442_22484 [Phytophthora nicotianae P10297]ETL41874.1 hypothetical protein L916_07214 [Phytophthora nicotianae]